MCALSLVGVDSLLCARYMIRQVQWNLVVFHRLKVSRAYFHGRQATEAFQSLI